MGDQNATAAPSGSFTASDGPLNIAANQQQQFETLCTMVGRPDLVTDPRFAEREARKRHRLELNTELNAALRQREAAHWEQLLTASGVPAARIATVAQALALEQLEHRGFLSELPYPDGSGRVLRVCGNGVQLDGLPLGPQAPPPLLGQHNGERDELTSRWLAS
jgi:crotonobetainyl-CoA:carnitine CoA-transferase CaiB-like acyl-CoA transferase